jgi:hypothetical protein
MASSRRSATIVPITLRRSVPVRDDNRKTLSTSPPRAGSTLLPAYPTTVNPYESALPALISDDFRIMCQRSARISVATAYTASAPPTQASWVPVEGHSGVCWPDAHQTTATSGSDHRTKWNRGDLAVLRRSDIKDQARRYWGAASGNPQAQPQINPTPGARRRPRPCHKLQAVLNLFDLGVGSPA